MAAGSGLRMGGDTRKQYINVSGRPLFTYALETFDRSDIITDIMIIVPEGDQEYCRGTVESSPADGSAAFPCTTACRLWTGPVTMSSFTTVPGLSSMMTRWRGFTVK